VNAVKKPADGYSWIEAGTTLGDGAICNSVAIALKPSDSMLERATMFSRRPDHRPQLIDQAIADNRQASPGQTELILVQLVFGARLLFLYQQQHFKGTQHFRFVIPPAPACRGSISTCLRQVEGETTRQKSPWMQGPEGRPPNVSPARKGWETDPEDDRAP
jgi:hypothetical protein